MEAPGEAVCEAAPSGLAKVGGAGLGVRPLRRRWLMLALFSLVSAANGFQWIQFSIVSNSVAWYYGVSLQAVDVTSLVYMVAYLPFILPASWLLDRKGLRCAVLVAAMGNCLAAWLKVVAARRDLFGLLLAAQTLAAIMQTLVMSAPPKLAAVWFGADQLSTATALGVLANQVGNALGFAGPALLVRSPGPAVTADAMASDLRLVGYISAGVTSTTLALVAVWFQAAPPVPPSVSQQSLLSSQAALGRQPFLASVKAIALTPGMPALLLAFGLSVGVTYAASTVLNALVLSVFPDSEGDAGLIGLCMVVVGLGSAMACGLVLDRTGKYKQLTVALYCGALASVLVFTAALFYGRIWAVFAAGVLIGLTLVGSLPAGFELAAELTYPLSESTASGLLCASAQVLGVALTLSAGALIELPAGWRWGCAAMAVALAVAAIATVTIPDRLRRQAALRGEAKTPATTAPATPAVEA